MRTPRGGEKTCNGSAPQPPLPRSVFAGEATESANAQAALDYLLRHKPAAIDEPYVLALVVNALLAIRPGDAGAPPYLERLEAMSRHSADGKLTWWNKGVDSRTTFYGAGPSGNGETTALAPLA